MLTTTTPTTSSSAAILRTTTGAVTMASLSGKARLSVDDGDDVAVEFSPEDETKVTLALYEHARLRLRVRGEAEIDGRGKLRKVVAKKVVIEQPADPTAHSEALFERLAAEDPDRLLALIESGSVRPTMLTYAAEIAGSLLSADRVVPVLLRLLQHESPIVREGALYGLREHQWTNDDIRVSGAMRAVRRPRGARR